MQNIRHQLIEGDLAIGPLVGGESTRPHCAVLRDQGHVLVVHTRVYHDDGTCSHVDGSYTGYMDLAIARFVERIARLSGIKCEVRP